MCRPQHAQCEIKPSSKSDFTIAPAHHPEFGYLCPSAAVRQRIRAAIVSAGVGMLVGGVIVLSLMDRRFADGPQNEQITTAARMDQYWTSNTRATDSANQVLPATIQGAAIVPNVLGSCVDDNRSFLNRKCRLINKRKTYFTRPGVTRLATTAIGRIQSATDIERPVAASTGRKSTHIDGDLSEPAAASPAPLSVAPERAAAPLVKTAKRPRIRERTQDPKVDGVNAFAYAFPYDQHYRHNDRYRSMREAFKNNWNWSW
jgi:murein DD-endopeptidase MepM/ murein hydrolase activator NlpD